MASKRALMWCFEALFVLAIFESCDSCPPQYAPLLPCPDFNWDTRASQDPRNNGLECFLQHVAKGRSTDNIPSVNAVEHTTVTRSCHPLGDSLKYRYHTPIHPYPRSHRWIRQIESPTYHWTKNGQTMVYGDEQIVFHYVGSKDDGLYSCTYMERCMYQSKHNGFCYYKLGNMFRLTVSAAATKATGPGLTTSTAATTVDTQDHLRPILPESPDFALPPLASSASRMLTLSTTALVTAMTLLPAFSADQAVGPLLAPTQSPVENEPTSVKNSNTVLEETEALEMEEDITDPQHAPRFHYPEECPACTGNCPCNPYQRKRKDIVL